MKVEGCPLLYILLFALFAALSRGQFPPGFINIDCGIPEGTGYVQNGTNVEYTSDEKFVDTGKNWNVSLDFSNGSTLYDRFLTLRSYPTGIRNCYTLRPVELGKKYLVRAAFLYGNYDGLQRPPAFDLYLDVNLWLQVRTSMDSDPVRTEIIAVAPADWLSVCLVNTDKGVPFVSVIELRPLPEKIYPLVNTSQSLVLFEDRRDYGGDPDGEIKYPEDPYDRFWFTSSSLKGWINVSTALAVSNSDDNEFLAPSAVMRTAVTTGAVSESLDVSTAPTRLDDEIYVFLHFAELKKLEANETREMDVYLNGYVWYQGFSPEYLSAGQLVTDTSGSLERHDFSIRASNRSTLPPILNGMEVYALKRLVALPTDTGDVDAILSIKTLYGIKKNWEGDPCTPQIFRWEGLSCTYNASPRITSLNLASSGLSGGIPTSIVNLTNIKNLDLSQNNLIGEIPEFLAELPSLQMLNLAGNKLRGLVPQLLYERSLNGSLSLRIEGNPDLCYNKDSCQKKKKKRIYVLIIIAALITLVVLITISVLIWVLKRRCSSNPNNSLVTSSKEDGSSHLLKHKDHESQQFTSSEIANITNSFEKQIGRGGFGVVYYGCLKGGIQVAVKMLSKLSSQGVKEFKAEVLTLMRVHHRNLVSLLGYCDEKDNLALVYEYMAQGSLVDHLRGKATSHNSLSWRVRLRIALEAAVGLEYLHNGCKPPIIHRDVKTANILLDQNWEAKIADFGLSRAFTNEDHSHISTTVAGTLGYLDPEYQRTFKLNEKSDVYSFGVVLLELITGKPPILHENGKATNTHIVDWVRPWLQRGDIESIADPSLQGEYDQNSIWVVLEIAMSCTSSASSERATMNNIVMQLKECIAPYDASDTHRLGLQDSIVPMDSSIISNPVAR